MKFSEIKNRAVVDLNTAQKIGNLESLVVKPGSPEVVGLKVKAGGIFTSAEVIPISQLQSIGQDAITVSHLEAATTPDKSQNPMHDLPDLSSIIGHQVVTQSGKLIGDVDDVSIDPITLAITGFVVSQSGLFTKKHQFPITSDLNFGAKIIIMPDALATQLGLGQ